MNFLTEELETLFLKYNCSYVLIVGDLNFHLEQEAYNDTLMVQGLAYPVTFHTHERRGLLEYVTSDLPRPTSDASK